MKWFLIFWATPLVFLGAWYGLSYNDVSFGFFMLTRETHDLVFKVYGSILGIAPERIPPLVARALVVDTGIHAFGWTRQEAIDLMIENSALSLTNITTEVDRYISWPGQALGYKMGEIVIRDLREQAETRLGEAFDLRAFHDTVLATGPVPLEVLETLVVEWIDEQAAAVSAGPAPGAR